MDSRKPKAIHSSHLALRFYRPWSKAELAPFIVDYTDDCIEDTASIGDAEHSAYLRLNLKGRQQLLSELLMQKLKPVVINYEGKELTNSEATQYLNEMSR